MLPFTLAPLPRSGRGWGRGKLGLTLNNPQGMNHECLRSPCDPYIMDVDIIGDMIDDMKGWGYASSTLGMSNQPESFSTPSFVMVLLGAQVFCQILT